MSDELARSRPAEVLLVEDDDNDVELTRLSFKRTKLAINLHRVKNGEECVAFLRKQGVYADVPTPDLVLLDLNMPRMDGREVLAAVGGDEDLKQVPIVVLTTSPAAQDILDAYKLHCRSYVVKPVDFEQFSRLIQSIADYWFTVVALPPKR